MVCCYLGYLLSSHIGESTIKIFIYALLGMLTGFLFIGEFPKINFIQIIIVICSAIFAILIDTLFVILIGLFSFKIEDANPIYWLYSKIILVLGTIFPIEYFPIGLQVFLKYSPIYVVSYGPAKLFVDFNYTNAIFIIIAQLIYIISTYSLCMLIYKKGVRQLNVNGG